MEKKPIKRNEHIVKLSKDHHFTLLFCWKIRTGLAFGVDPERIKEYVRYFWPQLMQPHFREEETLLFAPVHDKAVQRALAEHAQIEAQIQAVERAGSDASAQLTQLADLVDNHVRYEERELFPHLENLLTQEQLEAIGRQLSAAHEAPLTDDFADAFWLKKKKDL